MSWENDAAGFLAELSRSPGARQPATIGEIWNSEWKRGALDTVYGVEQPFNTARDELVAAIEGAAGKSLREYALERGIRSDTAVTPAQEQALLNQIADTLPEDRRKALEPLRDIRMNAAKKAQKIEAEAEEVSGATYGLSGHATAFIAGVARQSVDPVNLVAMAATGPLTGGARAGLLRTVTREAVANAGAQAIAEPAIEPARAELGLESGFGRGAMNVLEAGIGGAALSGLFHTVGRGLRALRSPQERVAPEGAIVAGQPETRAVESRNAPDARSDQAAPDPPPAGPLTPASPAEQFAPDDFHAAGVLADRDRVIDAMSPVDTAEGRIDSAAKVEAAAARIDAPGRVSPEEEFAEIRSKAAEDVGQFGPGSNRSIDRERAIRENFGEAEAATYRVEFDRLSGEAVVQRMAARKPLDPNDIVTQEVGEKKPRGRAAADPQTWSLFEFLASQGGLAPHSELEAIFGSKKGPFVPSFGPLIRKGGRTLDDAFRLAKENGYAFDAADVTGAQKTQNFNELLRMITEQQSGRRQYRQDFVPESKIDPAEEAAAIGRRLEEELQDTAGAAIEVDPEISARVVEIIRREGGTDVLAAYERAIMEDAERFEGLAAARQADAELAKIPGWDADDAGAAPRDGAPDPSQRRQAEGAGQSDVREDGEAARAAGEGDGAPRQLGDPALAADAARVIEDAGGDLEITLQNPDGSTRTIKASEALREVEADAKAADELNACIAGAATEEPPF